MRLPGTPVKAPPTYTSLPLTTIALTYGAAPLPRADQPLVASHLAMPLHPLLLVQVPAWVKPPPTYTLVSLIAIASTSPLVPVPRADHWGLLLMGPHLAMLVQFVVS